MQSTQASYSHSSLLSSALGTRRVDDVRLGRRPMSSTLLELSASSLIEGERPDLPEPVDGLRRNCSLPRLNLSLKPKFVCEAEAGARSELALTERPAPSFDGVTTALL